MLLYHKIGKRQRNNKNKIKYYVQLPNKYYINNYCNV